MVSTGRGVPVLACRAGHGGTSAAGQRPQGWELRGVLLAVWLGRGGEAVPGCPELAQSGTVEPCERLPVLWDGTAANSRGAAGPKLRVDER
ncbi:MAG: hypothetical protein ACRDS0_31155 [Pseudonocardiaceae bacterium]